MLDDGTGTARDGRSGNAGDIDIDAASEKMIKGYVVIAAGLPCVLGSVSDRLFGQFFKRSRK